MSVEEYIVELKWKCHSCDSINLGRDINCVSCGNPKEIGGEINYIDDGNDEQNIVNDEALKSVFNGGEDIFCLNCGSGNRNATKNCTNCGSSLLKKEDEIMNENNRERKLINTSKPEPINANNITSNATSNKRIEFQKYSVDFGNLVPFFGIVLIIMIGIPVSTCVYNGFKTKIVNASIIDRSWIRGIKIDKWVDYEDKLKVSSTREKQRGIVGVSGVEKTNKCSNDIDHYIKVPCGTYEDCEDVFKNETENYSCTKSERYVCGENISTSCSNNKNGSKTCRKTKSNKYCTRSVPDTCSRTKKVKTGEKCETKTKYCDKPVYEEYCYYIMQRWNYTGFLEFSNKNHNVIEYPKYQLKFDERISTYEKYNLYIKYMDSTQWVGVDYNEYMQYQNSNDISVKYSDFVGIISINNTTEK